MEKLQNESFLLRTDTARRIYELVSSLPLIDYHNHLSLEDIRENRRFTDVYDLWIRPDPYKHRAMRMCGVPEKMITGSASAKEKFVQWCTVFPELLGNPLYLWSRMELETVFGITQVPCKENAEELYDACNRILGEREVTPRSLMASFGVETACPCVSILDDVSLFENDSVFSPSLRGDDILYPTQGWVKSLEKTTKCSILSLSDFCRAVSLRLDVICAAGCRFSDLALDNGFVFYPDDGRNQERFLLLLQTSLTPEEQGKLASWLLTFLGAEFSRRKLVLQLHLGAQRHTSTKLRAAAGAAGGFAAMGNSVSLSDLVSLLDAMDQGDAGLPKLILFPLNPADNAMISTLSGSFSKDGVAGVITQGPAWWWCDHRKGIRDMLENTASFSLLSNFMGMTTDSRSFLSFVRHDYFRRILCDLLGEMAESGELICSLEELKKLAKKLCYENAKKNWR